MTDSTKSLAASPELGASTTDPERTASFDTPLLPTSPATSHPTTIAGHEILGILGRGGMGIVYKARHLTLKRVVALKMVLAGEHASTETLERFRIEAEAAARLQHPNVVQIYEVGADAGRPFLSLEYVSGGTLTRKLNDGPLAAKETAGIVQVLARAVHHAHQQGIVHRDLKPANVLLTGDGLLKISDFGLAKLLAHPEETSPGRQPGEQVTRTGQVMGTPSYMAPEQARGDIRDIGPSADVYALGAMLYEMLTGRPPFKAAGVLATLDLVRHTEPLSPRRLQPSVPRDLETICLKCLEKKPHRRYRSAAELADRLGLFLEGKSIPDRPYGPLERAWRWCRRRPLEAALLGCFFLALVLGLGWWWRDNALSLALLRQQAEQARQEQYVGLREAARALARRGDWTRAVEFYDRALPDAGDETLALQVERVRALFPLGRREAIQQQVEVLAKRTDLGDHTATLQLLQAELALGVEDAAPRLRELVGAASARGTLSKADQHHARALMAEDQASAISALESALAADPLHHRASVLLALALIHAQQFDRAEAQLRFHRRFFPEDPTGLFLSAWNQTWLGQRQTAVALLKELKTRFAGQFTAEQFHEMAEYLRLQGEMLEALTQLRPYGKAFAGPSTELKLVVAATTQMQARFGRGPVLRHFGIVVPNLPWYSDQWNACALAIQDFVQGHPERGLERLGPLIDRQPDALLLYLRAHLRAAHGKNLQKKQGNAPLMQQMALAAEDANQAAAAPAGALTLRRSGLLLAVLLDAFLYHVASDDPRPDWLVERCTRNHRRLLLDMQLQRDEHERLTHHLAAEFDQLDPSLVCPLLRDWLKQSPQDARPLRHLAQWELRAKNYAVALELAERRLATEASDAEMQLVRQQARHELQRLLERGK